ncbi:MAG: hypothetical protein ABI647_08775 [Gemmatimonadota bacterium]
MSRMSLLLLTPLVMSCGGGGGAAIPGAKELRGIVHHLPIEGGVYVIDVNETLRYQPLNLPAELRKDGLKVRFVPKSRDDMMGTAQVGRVIELVTIAVDSTG